MAAAVCALVLGPVAAAPAYGRDFDNPASGDGSQQFGITSVQRDDTPDDPDYDKSEPDDPDSVPPSTNLYDERFDLFGFPSRLTRLTAQYAAGPNATACAPPPCAQVSGFNAAGYTLPAHKRYVAIRAIDDAGNVGWEASIDTTGPNDGGGGGPNPPQGQTGRCLNPIGGSAKKDRLEGTEGGDARSRGAVGATASTAGRATTARMGARAATGCSATPATTCCGVGAGATG